MLNTASVIMITRESSGAFPRMETRSFLEFFQVIVRKYPEGCTTEPRTVNQACVAAFIQDDSITFLQEGGQGVPTAAV